MQQFQSSVKFLLDSNETKGEQMETGKQIRYKKYLKNVSNSAQIFRDKLDT